MYEEKNESHNRRSLRLIDYDYATPGAYYVTILSYRRFPIFSKIHTEKVQLSQIGIIVEDCWRKIPYHFPFVRLRDYVIMPNHLHGIIDIKYYPNVVTDNVFTTRINSLKNMPKGPQSKSLSAIIGSFKSATTKHVHRLGLIDLKTIWHRNYYEHIIRDNEDLQRIADYIHLNPSNWENDLEYFLQ